MPMPLTVTARFPDADAARAAATSLERRGVDASSIAVRTVAPIGQDAWDSDRGTTASVGRRSVLGGVIGAVLISVISAGVVLIIGPEPLALTIAVAVLGGAIAGALLGGFWAGAGDLPVQENAYDTYGPSTASTTVVVHLDGDDAGDVRVVLADAGAADVTVREPA
jgi:hypothetical protein